MAQNRTTVDARPNDVFDVLLDPSQYAHWVVGAKTIRSVDANWPAAGSAFHHSIGFGPVHVKDKTLIEEVDPPRFLALRARALPAGVARVTLTVTPDGPHRTTIVMDEAPVAGPADKLPQALFEPLIAARNTWSLRRLRRLVEQRAAVAT